MIKISNGYSDFCIPWNENQAVMLDILNEMIDGELKIVSVIKFTLILLF